MSTRFLLGLVGADVGGSHSPALYEREAQELGIRVYYTTVEAGDAAPWPGDFGRLLRTARSLGFTGLNVTHPCKQAFLDHLDDLSPDAAALGAVNTVVLTGGRAVGHNTDLHGFATSFRAGLAGVPLSRVLLVGAGGAGAAAAYALQSLGASEILLHDTDEVRAKELADRLPSVQLVHDVEAALSTADGLVNATPVGMGIHPGVPVPVSALRAPTWVVDVIYRPAETALLRAARELGCRTLNGGGMLVHQAAKGFELFTGRAPDVGRMLAHFAVLNGHLTR
ncbi:shikimate dehydrogenase [Hamadaea tsunoensis]|uniref:shikimate dehydrogenase n=1 Tax=Hamadaea tsunoensis TaxID=53368 RepID=UPI00040B06C1|nr:shikimate dehydrogenase [Hamadaea tsunoensis]